jgi:hypothetical protein
MKLILLLLCRVGVSYFKISSPPSKIAYHAPLGCWHPRCWGICSSKRHTRSLLHFRRHFVCHTSEFRLWAMNMGFFFPVLYFLQLPSCIYYPQLNLKCLCKWGPTLSTVPSNTYVYIMLDPSWICNSSGASIMVIGSNISCQGFFSPFPHTTGTRLYFDCIDGFIWITLKDRQPRLRIQFKQRNNMQIWYDCFHRSNENLLFLATIHFCSDVQWILRCTSNSCKDHQGISTILIF